MGRHQPGMHPVQLDKAINEMGSRARGRLSIGAATVLVLAFAWVAWVTLASATEPPAWTTWRVGDPARVPVTVPSADAAAATARATSLLRALGIEPASVATARSLDQVRQLTIDTSIGRDAAGEPLATLIVDVDTDGVRTLVRFARGMTASGQPLATGDVAPLAVGFLGVAGISPPDGRALVSWDEGMDAWWALWPRQIGGIAAPDDFTAVWIFPTGQVRAISNIVSTVAPTPAAVISQADAQATVKAFLDGAPGSFAAMAGTPYLEWEHANDFANPALPDAPDPTLSMVYVVPYQISLSGDEKSEGVLWVDAASGEIVGGGAVT
jgi:hypothetical protein